MIRALTPASLGVVFLCLASTGSVLTQQQFRAKVTLVPIEVRVLNRGGEPARELKREDFSISEDGVPQEIAHFERIAMDDPGATAGRTFVIVLGRGRLNEPTKAVQALVDFVRSRGLPKDRFIVSSYLRVTGPTTNREAVARFLEKYRDNHTTTESRLTTDGRTWPPQVITAGTRVALDSLFAGDLTWSDLPGGGGNVVGRHNDSRYLRSTLEYVRSIDAEKHVVFVTEKAFATPRVEDDPVVNYWFQRATSARAALSFIHAGGMSSGSAGLSRGRMLLTRFGGLNQVDEITTRQGQQQTAAQTGGTSAFFQYAEKPLAALDRATRFHYLMGYYPTREVPQDQYRRVEVSLKDRQLTLLYRQGYQAASQPETPEDYERGLSGARLTEAAWQLDHPLPIAYASGPRGIGWSIRLSAKLDPLASGFWRIAVAFDPLFTMFSKRADRYHAELDLLLLADGEGGVVGELRQRLKVELTEAEYARTKRQWPTVDVVLHVTSKPRAFRGVLYQFDTDRTASARLRLPN